MAKEMVNGVECDVCIDASKGSDYTVKTYYRVVNGNLHIEQMDFIPTCDDA